MDDRNNSIKTQKNNKTIYPYKVDITSIPERKYMFGIYYIAKYSYILLLLGMILSLITIIKSYERKINPYFIYWDEIETKFKELKITNTPTENKQTRKLKENTYLIEYFIRDYLEKSFTVYDSPVKNEELWCNCTNEEELKNKDFLNITKPCYICNFSNPTIYNNFIQNQKPYYEMLEKEGLTQEIKIINMEQLYNKTLSQKKRFIDYFLKPKTNQILSEYKVDFIVLNKKEKEITNEEVLTSYIQIIGPQRNTRERKVNAISYMYHPNYELILKREKINE